MVSVIGEELAAKTGVNRPPFVVEIAGPSAAGKSSLLRALIQSNGDLTFLDGPDRRRIKYIPFFVINALSSLPIFIRQYRNGRWFTWREIKRVIYLRGWHRILQRPAPEGTIIVLEKGPVLRLAQLRAFGPENIGSRRFERWWASTFNRWAQTLDMVIWLDAPDGILLERVRAKGRRQHTTQTAEERFYKEYLEGLARLRESFEGVFSTLKASGGPSVIRFDTDQESPDQIMEKALAAFERGAQTALYHRIAHQEA